MDPIYITGQRHEHAAIEENRAGGGQPADLYGYVTSEALAQLSPRRAGAGAAGGRVRAAGGAAATATAATGDSADQRLERVRAHLRRYRELAAQGKWAEAGKELEAIEAEVK